MSRPHPPSPVPSAAPAKRQRPVHIRDFTCLLCDVRCNDSTSLARHISSAQHRHHLLTAPAAGTTPAAAAPPPAPAVYIDRSTAVEQLFSVVQTMYPQTALVSRVVRHMFYTRTRRVAKTVVSESVRAAKTIDEYSALLLNAPMLEPLVQAARDRLAVADQPPSRSRMTSARRCRPTVCTADSSVARSGITSHSVTPSPPSALSAASAPSCLLSHAQTLCSSLSPMPLLHR